MAQAAKVPWRDSDDDSLRSHAIGSAENSCQRDAPQQPVRKVKRRSPYESLVERLAAISVTDPETGCRLLTTCIRPGVKGGYGVIRVHEAGMAKPKSVYAHRLSYELFVGPIPAGHDIDHKVGCPRCCIEPSHLTPMEATAHRAKTGWPKANPGKSLPRATPLR